MYIKTKFVFIGKYWGNKFKMISYVINDMISLLKLLFYNMSNTFSVISFNH